MRIVFMGENRFSPQYQRYELLKLMAEENEVCYIEPPFHIMQHPMRALKTPILTNWEKNLRVLHPRKIIPERYCLSAPNLKLASREISGHLTAPADALILTRPTFWPLAKTVPAKHYVYYCLDAYTEYDEVRNWPGRGRLRLWNGLERKVLGESDLFLAVSHGLLYSRMGMARRVEYLPHGLSPGTDQNSGSSEIPERIKHIPAPRVILLVHDQKRIDRDLLGQAAAAMPDVSFVVAGHGGLELNLPNIHKFGFIPRAELNRLLPWFEMGLLLYRWSRFHCYIGPIKFLELPAFGLPVIASGIPETYYWQSQYPGIIRAVNDAAELTAAVRSLLSAAGRPTQQEMEVFVVENSWRRRYERLVQLLASLD